MKKILVAVDGSIPSIHAAKYALELARPANASVTLIYVALPAVTSGDQPNGLFVDTREADLARGASILKNVRGALGAEGEQVATLTLVGSPAETIADTAMDEAFDLVVVGNTGRHAVSRMLLGSVADRLVHVCKRPTLVVR